MQGGLLLERYFMPGGFRSWLSCGAKMIEEVLQAEISFDLFHLQEKHQQVAEMIKKIEKNVKVVVKIQDMCTNRLMKKPVIQKKN